METSQMIDAMEMEDWTQVELLNLMNTLNLGGM